jgi:CxxC motif-containing protein (DUF1111 family)
MLTEIERRLTQQTLRSTRLFSDCWLSSPTTACPQGRIGPRLTCEACVTRYDDSRCPPPGEATDEPSPGESRGRWRR